MAAKEFTTEEGTKLPLLNLRGKPYLQIAHRLVWLTEKYANYNINTEFLKLEDDYSICRATLHVFDAEGNLVRSTSATKKETQKDFPDFVEKSETGSIGRALATIGIGTQFCTQDMEEGMRLADAPIPIAQKASKVANTASKAEKPPKANIPTVKVSTSFNKSTETANGW